MQDKNAKTTIYFNLFCLLKHLSFIAFPSSCFEQIYSFKYPGQHGNINLQRCFAGWRFKPFKCSLFETFVPYAKTGAVPEQYFAFVAEFVEEDKQMAAERIFEHKTFCQHRKLIKSATHICRLSIYEYFYRWWKCQHKPSLCKTESTLLNVLLSASEPIRKVLPEESTSSKRAWLPLGIATCMNADGFRADCLLIRGCPSVSFFRQL